MSGREEEAALQVVEILRGAGHVAYFAGGCVRDRLMGVPANDVDVATSARPDEVQALFHRTRAVGAQFAVVLVRLRRVDIEVATFRADLEYKDGRRPEGIRFTDAEEDARRRDFTINGLFYDPIEDRVIDYVGGVEDLRRGRVRAIGDPRARFDEDYLRILRAPRFAAALGFSLDPETAAAARERAPLVRQVAVERVYTELVKVLSRPTRARGLTLCEDLGILEVVLPEVREALPQVVHALDLLPADAPLPTVWAALLHRRPVAEVEAVLRRLRASNEERETAAALVGALEAARALADLEVARQKRLLRDGLWAEQVPALLRTVLLAGDGDLEPYRYLQARRRAYADDPSPAGLAAPPLVGGRDLKAAGLQPGRHFGRLLAQVEDAQLEGRVRTADEALALALKLAPPA